jgi:hypothetical protein
MERDLNSYIEATLDNVESVADRFLREDGPESDTWLSDLYSWLSENEPAEVESRDDQGGYPSDNACKRGLLALGLLDNEYKDEVTS